MEVSIKNREVDFGTIKIVQSGGGFSLQLGNLEFQLPLNLGKNLITAAKLQNHFHKKYEALGDGWDRDNTSFRYRSQHAYDCHQFALRCLGFDLSLKEIKNKTVETSIYFFGKDKFKRLTSSSDIVSEISGLFKDSNVLVGQIASKDEKGKLTLNHTFFVLKFSNAFGVLQKEGHGGRLALWELNYFFGDHYFNHPDNYGDFFAFSSYEDIANLVRN
jgi:hypothetical protein